MKKIQLSSLALICTIAASSQAVVVVEEQFQYPDGGFNLPGQNGGVGFDGAWGTDGASWGVDSETIVRAGDNFDQFRDLAAPLGGSFFARVDLGGTADFDNVWQNRLLFQDSGGNDIFFFEIDKGDPSGDEYRAWINGSSINAGGAYTFGDTDTIIIEFAFDAVGDETLSVWVNPTSQSDPKVITDFQAEAGVNQVERIRPISFNINGGEVFQDNIAVTTTFNEAVAIPEPARFAPFLGLLALAAAIMARRNKKDQQ